MSTSADKEIVIPPSEEKQPQEDETIPIPKKQYQSLLQSNMQSVQNTLNTLDNIDKIIASLVNVQAFVMNIKEKIKTDQLGMNQQEKQTAAAETKSNA